jgi:hypothetical protein
MIMTKYMDKSRYASKKSKLKESNSLSSKHVKRFWMHLMNGHGGKTGE